MDDLISRQQAIDALDKRFDNIPMEQTTEILQLRRDLRQLPSAQPTFDARDTQYNLPIGTDCISRQSAIDALRKLREEDIEDYGCEIPEGFNQDHLDRATFAIKQLPPIQPKLLQPWEVLVAQAVLPQSKRGKWIKTARWGRVYYCDQCRNYLDFDGVNAGRGSTNFCPNCGADMRQKEEDET